MRKTKKVLSLILVIMMILSSLTVAFAEVPATIPLRVKDKLDALGTNTVVFANNSGGYDIAVLTAGENLVYDRAAGVTSSLGGSSVGRYVSTNNGKTWTLYGTKASLELYGIATDIVYAYRDVLDTDKTTVIYSGPGDNIIPFDGPADLTDYNSTKDISELDDTHYTTASWQNLQTVISNNSSMTDRDIQTDVDAAENRILNARHGLVFANQQALDDAENQKESIMSNASKYTDDTLQVLINTDSMTENTNDEVGLKAQAILNAIDGIVLKADLTAYNLAKDLSMYTPSDFTTSSWENLLTVIANNVVNDSNTLLEVDVAEDNIIEARLSLVFSNQPDLDEIIGVVMTLMPKEEEYTSESWQALLNARDLPKSTKEDIADKINALQAALDGLVFLNQEDLDLAVERYNKLIESDYETAGWSELIEAIDTPKDEFTSNVYILNLTIAINDLIDKLIPKIADTSEYDALLDPICQTDYTEESFNAFLDAIRSKGADETSVGDLQSEIDAKCDVLREEIPKLVKLTPDLTEYNSLILGLVPSDYTPQSWADYINTMLNNTVDENSLVSEVENAITIIKEKRNALVQIPADLSAYDLLTESIDADRELYTEESFQKYMNIVGEIQVSRDELQSEVNKKYDSVMQAKELLVLKSDADNLKKALDRHWEVINELVGTDYTEQSWTIYAEVIEDNQVSGTDTLEFIYRAIDNILEAREYLVTIEGDLTDYQYLLDSVNRDDYTTDSWGKYQFVVSDNSMMPSNLQSEIADAIDNIFEAQKYLIYKVTINLYNKLIGVQNRNYTGDSWNDYIQAVEKNKIGDNPTNMDIDVAASNIIGTVYDLRRMLTREDYNFMVQYVALNSDKFNEETLHAVNAVVNANQLKPESTAEEIDTATNTIGEQISKSQRLDGKTNIFAYEFLTAMSPKDKFTTDSWDRFQEDIGHTVIDDSISGKAYEGFMNTFILMEKFLVEKEKTDLAEYNTLIASVKQADYTTESWTKYQLVIADNPVNETIAKDDLLLVITRIKNAQKLLVKKPVDNGGGAGGGTGGGGGGSTPTPPVIVPPLPPTPPITEKLTINTEDAKIEVAVKDTLTVKKEIKGYIRGYGDKTFRPDNKVTRAETTQMLSNIFETSGMLKPEITDIKGDEWYAKPVTSILSSGVMNGYGDKTFKPERNITRQEFAVTIVNLLDLSTLPTVDVKQQFKDIEGAYGKDKIELLTSLGILKGYPDGTFRPDAEITRAEMIVIINRLVGDRLVQDGSNYGGFDNIHGGQNSHEGHQENLVFIDINDSWARNEIFRAIGGN